MKTAAISDTARSFLQSAIETAVRGRRFEPALDALGRPRGGAPQPRLTPRQLDVLELLCEGLTNKGISRRLDIGNATVKIHVSSILRSLGVTSRLQAAIAGRRLGIIKEKSMPDETVKTHAERGPMVLRVVWDGATAQIIGVDAETIA